MQVKLCAVIIAFLASSAWARQEPRSPQDVLRGNRSLGSREILDHLAEKDLDILSGSALSKDDLERAARLIRNYCQDQGYPLAKARWQKSAEGVRFLVDEGPRASLGKIEFRGNAALQGKQLRDLLGLGKRLDFNKLEYGLERVRQAYRNAGFARAQVEQGELKVVEVEASRHLPLPFQRVASNRIHLDIEVEEGPRFEFGTIYLPDPLAALDLPLPLKGEVRVFPLAAP